MTSIYRTASSSRSLPPIPADALERGRAKVRLNTDPEGYANVRTASGAVSISLPPIRASGRGSKDEGGPLPGISSIIDQSELATRPARRLSETSRAYPTRDWDARHSPSWTLHPQRVDSTDSRPSSPDASALSSSTGSLASILEDRSSCTSPGPIPRFALGSRLPPLGPHSAFELSDLRTSLPSDESGVRRSSLSRTPVFRSPRSTPLPLSRPMSPAVQLSPRIHPLTRRLRELAVGEDREMESGTDTPQASVKSEPDTDSAPSSPRSKGISETDLFASQEARGGEQRDEQMACTPTQPDPKMALPWMDTEPSTPTGRLSPLARSPSSAASPEDEESKDGIIKQSESETDDEELSYEERRAKKRANAGKIDPTTVRTRGGNFQWLMASAYPPMTAPQDPELLQLQQQAERYGLKLQPDPNRPNMSQSQMLMRMAERQSQIERLQREQEEAAATYRMASSWGIDPPFGPLPIPDLAPPPLLGLSPVSRPIAQQNMFIPDPLVPDLQPALDLAAFTTPAYTDLPQTRYTDLTQRYPELPPQRYTDLAPTPPGYPDPYPSLSPPGLTATSSATSASSPSDSFYLSSPPPPSLSTQIMPNRSFNQDTFKQDAFKAQDAYKHDLLGFAPQEMIPEDEGFAPGASTSVLPSTGSGTHKCQSCGKTFRRPSGLKDHMNIHSGEKPYCCPLETCRKGFATRSNMIRHHNKTHPSRPKIGGVADIGGEAEDLQAVELDPTSPTEPGGSSSQGRFRVVQQNAGGKELGVGPVRSTKERRTMRKQTVSGPPPVVG